MQRLISWVMLLIEIPFVLIQKWIGLNRIAWLFLTPNLILFGVFCFLPIVVNFAYSVTGSENILLSERPYVGGDNFALLLNCTNYLDPSTCQKDLFWRAIWNTALFVVLQVTLMVVFSLLTALVLNRKIRARGFFRAVFFFPVLLSPVVVALVWKWILQRYGVLNAGLDAVGLQAVDWLTNVTSAFGWSIFLSIWAHMGFYTLILLAGLQAIPSDVYEAAQLDRASPWRVFRKITLPLLSPTMLVVLVLSLIKGVQTFDEVFAFTGGGPGSATTFIIQFIYQSGFSGVPRTFGIAAAASIMLAIVLIIITAGQFWINRNKVNG